MYLHASLLNIGSFEACKSLANSCGDSMPECFFASVSIDAGTALGGTSNVRKMSLSDDSILHPLNIVRLHV